ncbi:MAG: S8 family serine peptidase [Bdellovibrionales bacterium]|nr:S8 family serine peptidase [Bdellovibrionales bacterium]
MTSRGIFLIPLVSMALISCSKHSGKDPLAKAPGKFPESTGVSVGAKEIKNWFTRSPELDGAEGVNADKAIEELHLTHSKEIIVAVIDSGVDIQHEDLKDKIWTNTKEIAGNGIDDDHNGYIDDIHGWNYLGGYDSNGNPVHIGAEQLEVTRELVKMKKKKQELEEQGLELSVKDQAYLLKLQTEVDEEVNGSKDTLKLIADRLEILKTNYDVLKDIIGVEFDKMTNAIVQELKVSTSEEQEAKNKILEVFAAGSPKDVARYHVLQGRYQDQLDFYFNEDFHPRADIVGDNPEDFLDIGYGNNDVRGLDADHGTHVAGIIGASRNNSIGIDGIAENVRIMSLRAVPNGDERDKDVALAIRYAADNGANIINMSFGKNYSPHKHKVSEALLYAQSKGVLIFHAAGNESTDRDQESRYPEKKVFNEEGEVVGKVDSFLDIGASSSFLTRELTATFTNFGQTTVDIFAPGVNLLSSIPDNQYAVFSGTSMASPSAAGVAALVWSQKPELSAIELKQLMMSKARLRHNLLVRLPSDNSQDVLFETLSITGGIADAYRMLAE